MTRSLSIFTSFSRIFPFLRTIIRPANRKRTVKPGRQDHSSIPLHIQFHVSSVYGHLRIFFYFKRRRIAVACNDMISSAVIDRNGKSNDGGMISHDKIFSAFFQVPAFLLFQFCKALLQKTFFLSLLPPERLWGFCWINSSSFSVVSSYIVFLLYPARITGPFCYCPLYGKFFSEQYFYPSA